MEREGGEPPSEEPHLPGPREGQGGSSPAQIQAWLDGTESLPDAVRRQISAWLKSPTRESSPLPQEAVDAWFESLEPVPAADQGWIDEVLTGAVQRVLGPRSRRITDGLRRGLPPYSATDEIAGF